MNRVVAVKFKRALRAAWRKALAKLCGAGARDLRLPQAFVLWYGEDGEDGNPALRKAIQDSLRSFPGWDLPTRLAYYGTFREKADRIPSNAAEPLFDSGAIPYETLVEAHGEDVARDLLSESERKFYEARESERLAVAAQVTTSIPAASPRSSPCETLGLGAPLDSVAPPRRWSLLVDVRGVGPYDPDLHRGRVYERVRGADMRLASALRKLPWLIKRGRYDPITKEAEIALRSARYELLDIARNVGRRERPSVCDAAAWLREAFAALLELIDGQAGVDKQVFERDPPLAVSGLLAMSELRFLFDRITAAAEAAPPERIPE